MNYHGNKFESAVRRAIAAVALLITIAGFGRTLPAQSSRIDGGTVSQSKFGFYWETRLEPPTPPLADSISTAIAHEPGVIHRLLLDRARRVYVGYDAIVEPLSEPNTYRVTFRRLVMTPELAKQVLGESLSTWSQLPTPGWNPNTPKTVKGGEVLQLNLLVNTATSQRVVDYVTLQEPSQQFRGFQRIPERKFTYAPGPSRDFRADDAELTIESPRLSINGKLDESSARRYDEVSGSVVWIATGKRGRYILSLIPHPKLGFRKAGEVRGSSLSFVMGSDTFTLNTGGRIAPGQASFSLYVLHDPEWRPTYPDADLSAFFMGAADRPETLLRK
jgi:hypothetical protein